MTSYYHPIDTGQPIRVLLADPLTIVRQGIRSLLEQEPGIQVVADTAVAGQVPELALELLPDVIVMEVHPQLVTALDAVSRVKGEGMHPQVLILTDRCDRHTVVAAFEAGARGYLLKEADCHALADGIRAVRAMETYLGPRVSEALVSRTDTSRAGINLLTEREREILQLLAEGNNSKDIAFLLGISNKTVDTFRRQCLKKLQLKNSIDLIRYALREGMARL